MARTKIYEGKAKILYSGPQPGTLVQYFKDDATAFNNKKQGTIEGKGAINNRISEFFMVEISRIGIETHLIKRLNMREQLIHHTEIIPLEVIVRNIAAGSLCKRLGIEEGVALSRPMVEFCLKDDALDDPLVTEENIITFGWASAEELEQIAQKSLRINDFMNGVFVAIGINLVDFKIEFGRFDFEDGKEMIMLADEISPDSCRLWDKTTGKKMDKDRFRLDLGGVEDAYQEIARRLKLLEDQND